MIPHLKENTGQNITSMIRDGENGKTVTDKMADPGAKRKKIKLAKLEGDPKTVESQFKKRKGFITRGQLAAFIQNVLKFNL